MTKTEFLTAFAAASGSLHADQLNRALQDYERRFTEQILAGRSETEIVAEWGTPERAAQQLHNAALQGTAKLSISKATRLGFNGVGLLVLDCLLIGPTFFYLTVLSACYFFATLMYLCGIFVSAANLAGVNHIDIPAQMISHHLSAHGTSHFTMADVDIVPEWLDQKAQDGLEGGTQQVFHVSTRPSRAPILTGVGTTVIGMLLLILCFKLTGFSVRQAKKFACWQISVLKNSAALPARNPEIIGPVSIQPY